MNRRNVSTLDVSRVAAAQYEPSPEMPPAFALDRRAFIKSLGGGLAVLLVTNRLQAAEGESGQDGRAAGARDPARIDAWLHIGADGTVTVFTGKTEVGQNIRTSLAQGVAEELSVPVSSIRFVMADTDLVPFDQGTFGSRTTPQMNLQLRRVAATARAALLELAAAHFNVGIDALLLADGRIFRRGSADSVTFGQLTGEKELTRTVDASVPLRPATEWKVMGTSVAKVNGRDFVTGRHRYASDLKRPDMVYGRVLRPPSYGASLRGVETGAATALQGVKVIREGDFVGVVAPDSDLAGRALGLIRAEWKTVPNISSAELFMHLKRTAESGGDRGGNRSGDITRGLAAADHKLEHTYTVAFIAHAPLEPRAAVAEWRNGRMTVWTGTQRPFGVRSDIARALGLAEENVRVIVPDTGSAYGGKHTNEAATEAAMLARATGRPVKIVWTREEEFTWAYARPAGVIEISSGVRNDGTITAWEFHNYNSGGSGIACPYEVANQLTRFHRSESPLRHGSYRGLAATANNFARECHIDDMARAIGMDPVAFRLKNLTQQPRLRAVVETAAEKFGWSGMSSSRTRGVGFGCGVEKGSYIATCAEVEIDPASGEVRLARVISAYECGAVVNPAHVLNQVEGAILQGIGGAMFEALDFADGRVLNPRFSDYRVPRFRDMPRLETVILNRTDLPSAGAGETPIIAIAPAIGNAIAAATGVRLRALPMVPHGLRLDGAT